MRVLITGSSGTLGQSIRNHLAKVGHDVIVWDRRLYPPSQPNLYIAWLNTTAPEAIIHAATASDPTSLPNEDHLVSVEWSRQLALHADNLKARFLFISSVMVFCGEGENGPFKTTQLPHSPHPYGALKLEAETLLRTEAHHTTIVRIGWQIADTLNGNQMAAHLQEQQNKNGQISADKNWIPACSFVNDTAETIEQLLHKASGIYHVDSNTGWSFFEICKALSADLNKNWNIVPTNSTPFDQRLVDTKISCSPLSRRLPSLGAHP